MNKNLLLVLAVATTFFVAGCACNKAKCAKPCSMGGDMKAEEMAKPAEAAAVEAAAPAAEAVVNAAAPAAEAVVNAAEVNAEVAK